MDAVKRGAACSCGQLRIICEGEPARVSLCHCLACQRRTGNAFGVQAWFPPGRIGAPLGTSQQYVRRADSGREMAFSFCPGCGGTLFWCAEARPDLVAAPVGAFADPGFPAPGHVVWKECRHPWTDGVRTGTDDVS